MTTLHTLLAADGRLSALLERRGEIMALTQASGVAVLTPKEPGGLPHALRAALAARAAEIVGDADLAAHYRDRLPGLVDGPAYMPITRLNTRPRDTRLAAIVRHADRLAREPRNATKADIEALKAASVAEADIVRLSELAAFLSYQCRLVAGLRLLRDAA